jgi:hypothetical protein
MKLRYNAFAALYLTSLTFEVAYQKRLELIWSVAAVIFVALALLSLTSCVQSVTVRGKYADYTVTPHKPIEVEPAK